MPNNDWMSQNPYPTGWATAKAEIRTAATARHIADKPTEIVLYRDTDYLDPQTVRIEGKSAPRTSGQVSVGVQQVYVRSCTVFGLPTLDIAVGDRFGWDGDTYSVTSTTVHAGEMQANAERYQT